MSDNEIFECDKWDKKFTTKFSLTRHQFIHSNVKKFTWKYCPKKFALKQYLKEHEWIHTDDRPFVWGVGGCQMRFRQRGKLSLHRRKHKGYKMKEYTLIRNSQFGSEFYSETSSLNGKEHSNSSDSIVEEREECKKSTFYPNANKSSKGKRARKAKQSSVDSDSDFELPSQSIKIRLSECKRSLRRKPLQLAEIDQVSSIDDNDSEENWKQPDNERHSKQQKDVQRVNATENKARKYSNDSTHDASHWGLKLNLNNRSQANFEEPKSNGNSHSKFSVLLKAFQICQSLNSVAISQRHQDNFEDSKSSHLNNPCSGKVIFDENVPLNNISKILSISGLEYSKNGEEVNKSFNRIKECLDTVCETN